MNEQTLSWKEAARFWGEGKEIESSLELMPWTSFPDGLCSDTACFCKSRRYRIKPVVPTVTEEKGKRFERANVSGIIYYQDWSSPPIYKSCEGDEKACVVMNYLNDENEDLKQDLEAESENHRALKEEVKWLKAELAQEEKRIEAITKELDDEPDWETMFHEVQERYHNLHDENEALKNRFDNEVESYKKEIIRIETELSRARDTIYVMTHGSNDKQLTTTQTTPNIPKEIKEEYEFCKSILSTKSPVCPEVPRASNEKTDDPEEINAFNSKRIAALAERLEKVEKCFASFIKNQQMANNPYFKS